MKKLLLPVLIIVVLLSGCIEGTLYKNDLISLEGFSVYPKNPYAGSTVMIQFFVENNGDMPIERAKVEFSLAGGAFSLQEIKCQDGTASGASCEFTKIQPLDMKRVSLTIKAPTYVGAQTPFTISYKVSYDASGYRQANIPIVDGVEKTIPTTAYKESSSTYGPIQAEFEPPVGMEVIENNRVVDEYWGTEGQPFLVKINFKDVASSSVGKASKFTLPSGVASLTLSNVQIASGLPCDFEGGASEKDVKIPGSLYCNFISSGFSQNEGTAVIGVNFDYTYEYDKSIDLTVMPVENT